MIGGGISGLAAAHRIGELDPTAQVALYEAGPRLGGVLQSTRRDGFLIEHSADSFITKTPWAIDLAQRVGLGDDLLPTDEAHRRAFVVRRGELHAVPVGFQLMVPRQLGPLLGSRLLSTWGKLRVASEALIGRRRTTGDESLTSFATRRLGREAFERLVQPLVGGIYTADPDRLSMAATFPQMLEMEQSSGSLIRAAWKDARAARRKAVSKEKNTDAKTADDSGARYSLFLAPRNGMGSLADAVVERLPAGAARLNAPLSRVERGVDGQWSLFGADQERLDVCHGVIVATRASHAARLLGGVEAPLAADLGSIEYAGSSVVVVGYRREQVRHPLDGFGFVVPAIENRRILAASFTSIKFPGRAPPGHVLLRVFVGGALQPALAELDDGELSAIVGQELGELIGVEGPPVLCEVHRWRAAMPQYHVGHVDLIRRIEDRVRAIAGLALAGGAYHGVGVPQCIRSGELAAERLLEKSGMRTGGN